MRFEVHNYALDGDTCVLQKTSMVGLVQKDYVTTEWMQDTVLDLRVGDEQLSDHAIATFIRRVE